MPEDALETPQPDHISWHEQAIPVRGCQLALAEIKALYEELQAINKKFGEQVIATLAQDEGMSAADWEAHKAHLMKNAFCLTTSIDGAGDQRAYGETADIFESTNLPKPIKIIYFTNVTAFQRNASGSAPQNKLEVVLDFGKPDIFDPRPLVSAATPNESKVAVRAQDVWFFNAVRGVMERKLPLHRTWYGALHWNFAYDIGILFVAMPISLYFSAYYMDQIIPDGSKFYLFRWPLFVYFIWISMVIYRGLVAYTKWAFPVNVLFENKDRAWRHRVALGAFALWLFYKVASSIYGIIIG